jgi:hypothetical protein
MKIIPLTKGMETIVDDEDYWIRTLTWVASLQRDRYYAKTPRGIYMHRLLISAKKGETVDHINGCTLDNRMSNLRICTRGQNQQNGTTLLRRHNTTGFRGVFIDKRDGGIVARILLNNKGIYLGRFKTKEEAAREYDKAARLIHGEFATLNFKEE